MVHVHFWQNGTRCRCKKYCGGIPILFGWFLRVPSLHACACLYLAKFIVIVFVVFFIFACLMRSLGDCQI